MDRTLQKRKCLQARAENDAVAALELARSFGFERPRSFRHEVDWYRRAAEMGNVEAQNLLGECYRDGHGVRRNLKLGIKLLLLAAKRGEPNAQVSIGYQLFYGEHIKRDRPKAIYWY
ncbi:MAG: tetratricopeptide repeat protein, partial [Verrucomicrobiia bacterium]